MKKETMCKNNESEKKIYDQLSWKMKKVNKKNFYVWHQFI